MATSSASGKVFTENPFVDELIYYVKQIGPNCVVKNETQADNAETLESQKAADLYIACYEGRAVFDMFDSFPADVLRHAGVPEQLIPSCEQLKYNIPSQYRNAVVNKMMTYYVDNYQDLNNYYRMLTGLPDTMDTQPIYLREDQIPENMEIDRTLPLHEQDQNTISYLKDNGILDQIIAENPTKEYLRYIDKNISPYDARIAFRFQLLYQPITESDVVDAKFKDKYNVNRDYILRTVYSEAFKYESDYYDNIIAILIILQTMIDLISEVQEHIARRDVFDERCIKYIFQSYGIPYYTEIPLKYQISMMKNLNTLLKFKSTSRCMLEICSIFGFDDIRIFKYFLLRDRKLDENGEYVFNFKEETVYHKGEPITEVRNTILVTEEMDTVTVPFPFENYMEKGNAFMVKIGNTLLGEDDYTLIGDQLTFKNPEILHEAKSIEFIFYYNEEGQAQNPIDTSPYAITIVSNHIDASNGVDTYDLQVPEGFDFSDGLMNVIIGSVWISPRQYELISEDGSKNYTKIKFLSFEETDYDGVDLDGRIISFMYVFAKNYNLHAAQEVHTAGDLSEVDIVPKPPTENYLGAGNSLFVTIGGTYVRPDRYGVTSKALMFLDSEDRLQAHRDAVINYVYGDFETPGMVIYEKDVMAETPSQREFEVPFPFENYLEKGYQMYVRVGITDMYDYQYNVFQGTLTFTDASISISMGQNVHFTFIYPENFEKDLFKAEFVKAEFDKQRDFTIPWPYPKYVERGNLYYIQLNGRIIDQSKYEVDGDQLHIYTIKDSLDINEELVFCFFYRQANEYNVAITQATSTALVENQDGFPIEFPFFDYLDSGNSFFVTVGSTFIDQSRYEVREGALYFTDGTVIDKGRDVTFTFIYNTIYQYYDKYVNSDSSTAEITPSGENASIPVPWPYPNFLEDEGNSMIIVVGGQIIDPMEYDIFEDRLYFADLDKIIEEYGTNLRFEFHYSRITEETVLVDDDAKNYELKFVKVPLTADIDTYIKNQSNYLDYDLMVTGDPLWDGEYDHEDLKKKILETEFSYVRTKYISIDNIENMAQGMLDMPYFFNLFFDDVKLEELLTLKLPSVKPNKNFKLNDTLVFMVILTFEYSNLEDTIMDTMGKILYLTGFNFRADITELQNWIVNKQGYDYEKTRLGEMIIPTTSIRSYKALLNLFTTNMDIYKHVVKEMYDADNKRIYDIYKKIYQSCMRFQYNRDFFQIADGSGEYCKTYTDFLKYRDADLYNLVVDIRSIEDEQTRQNRILEVMDGILRSMDEYISTDEYRYLWIKFPGNNADAVKKYVEMMINFFKSYKVELKGINTVYMFDDKYSTMVRPIDGLFEFSSETSKEDYMAIKDSLMTHMNTTWYDHYSPKEKLYWEMTYWLQLILKDKITDTSVIDKFYSLLVHLVFNDSALKDIYDKFGEILSSFEMAEFVQFIDLATNIARLNPKDEVSPLDRIFIAKKS